jgi:hypothetical protein
MGNSELALKIQSLLLEYQPIIDEGRGIDHGVWSVFDHDSILRYRRIFGKSAKLSVPTEEHFIP